MTSGQGFWPAVRLVARREFVERVRERSFLGEVVPHAASEGEHRMVVQPGCGVGLHLADVSGADAVLLSGTGLPTVGMLETLEQDLGKPVISSNQALLWRALLVWVAGHTTARQACDRLGARDR